MLKAQLQMLVVGVMREMRAWTLLDSPGLFQKNIKRSIKGRNMKSAHLQCHAATTGGTAAYHDAS